MFEENTILRGRLKEECLPPKPKARAQYRAMLPFWKAFDDCSVAMAAKDEPYCRADAIAIPAI